MYIWNQYNERLVRRGEIFISADILSNWHKELAVMNRNKRGRRFLFPDSFMRILGYAKVYFGLPYRQTEGLIRTYSSVIPRVPDYTAIHKRISKLDIKVNPGVCNSSGSGIVLVVDSTGIKLTRHGDWMRHKWNNNNNNNKSNKTRRGFLKIHVGVDADTKQVLALKITDEHSHDSRQLPYLVRQATGYGTISKVIGDGAYDSKRIFSYLDGKGIIPAIKVKQNSMPKTMGCYPRKLAIISQQADYKKWCRSVSYGRRWTAESVFSVIKRMLGEDVRSRKKRNMMQELRLKISLYNMWTMA